MVKWPPTIFIGVDPGLSGGIAILHSQRVTLLDMPTRQVSEKGFVKRAVDCDALARWLEVVAFSVLPPQTVMYVERVNAFPGQGVASMFSLGMSYWGVVGVAAGLGIPVKFVEPERWKAAFKLGREKADALVLARRLYPTAELGLAKHHGRAEALLIARYGKLQESNCAE